MDTINIIANATKFKRKDIVRQLTNPTAKEIQDGFDAFNKAIEKEKKVLKLSQLMWASSFEQVNELFDYRFELMENLNAEQMKAKDFLQNWDPFKNINKNTGAPFGLCLTGKPGNGKTHMLKCFINKVIRLDVKKNFKFISHADLTESLKDSDQRKVFFDEIVEPWGLIIDDFGTGSKTDFQEEQLFRILEARKRANKAFFISSNLTKKEIQARYHSRILSRFAELFIYYEVEQFDFRRVINQRNRKTLEENLRNERINNDLNKEKN